jgi:GNAT superfamily N-acetyltransferase
VTVRALEAGDAEALVALRRQALAGHPLSFGSSLTDDRLSLEFARNSLATTEEEKAIFGAFAGDALIGMVGIVRSVRIKQRHRADVWGMYVAPEARGGGLGRALLGAAIARARIWSGLRQVHLAVTESSPVARTLYESMGFQCWGLEPRALGWEGRFVDEFHMALDLSAITEG